LFVIVIDFLHAFICMNAGRPHSPPEQPEDVQAGAGSHELKRISIPN
jgi:hypothetical protein